MKKQLHPTYIYIPEDLWREFEAKARIGDTSGPLPYLRHVIADNLHYRGKIVEATRISLTREAPRSDATVHKGVRWSTEFWDKIRDAANKLHTTKEGGIRLIIEGEVAEP